MKKFFAVVIIVLLLVGIGGGAYWFLTQESLVHEHEFDEWTLTKEATCLSDGIRERKCPCGYSVKETVKATGHAYGDPTTVELTCTQDGCTLQICVNCGDEMRTNVVEATGHEYGEWVTAVVPTCTQAGMKKRACRSCAEIDYQVMDMTHHVFSTVNSSVIDGTVMLTEVCSSCGYASEELHKYEPVMEDTQSDPYAFDCSTDFSFEIRCDKDEQYIYEHLRVLDFYYEGTEYENTDICLHPFVASKTDKEHIWLIQPTVPYKENYTYVARLSGEMSLLTYKQDYLKFYIQGPEVAEVEYRDNMLFLQALENEIPGYYPYDLRVDEEKRVMILTLSQVGVFTDEMIGKTLCVGPCSSTEELSQAIHDCDIGVISTIRWENDKVIVVLEAPNISDLYSYINVNGNEGLRLPAEFTDEAQLQNLAYSYLESPAFAKIATATFLASKAYAKENGYDAPQYTDLKFDPNDIKIKLNVMEPKEMGIYQDATVGLEIKISHEFSIYKTAEGGKNDGKITVPIEFTCKAYIYAHNSTSFDGVWDAINDCITGDFRMHVDFTIVTELDLFFGLKLEYEKASEKYYAVMKSTEKIHTTSCKVLNGRPVSSYDKKTLQEIMRDNKNYEENECKVCQPFTSVEGYVVEKDEILHASNCWVLKKYKNPDLLKAFETFPLNHKFKSCSECLPDAGKAFLENIINSTLKTEWSTTLEGIRGYTKDVLTNSKKQNEQIFGGEPVIPTPIPIIPGAHVCNLDIYSNLEWDFDIEALFDVSVRPFAIIRFGFDLKREKGENLSFEPFVQTPGPGKTTFVSENVGKTNTLGISFSAMAQGKVTAEIGWRGGLKLSFVGCEKLIYAGIDIVVGVYGELSGMLAFEASTLMESPEIVAVAQLEIGLFAKLRFEVFIKNVFEKNGSLVDDIKVPIYSCGDQYAYYAFTEYEQTLNIGSDRNYTLPQYLLNVRYYDLETMKLKEGTLKFEGKKKDYSVKVVLRDKDGNPVDYCTYENGCLTVEDNAPQQFEIIMEIAVVDESVPKSLLEYLNNKANRSNNGSYNIGSKEVVVRYESELANMAITSITPVTPTEIMEGEEVTFKITADEGVKYGVAFYYHDYQDELARFSAMADSYTVTIPEAGTHMITVYPLDQNGDPIRGEGLGKSYQYVTAHSYDVCTDPIIVTKNNQTVKQGTPFTVVWTPPFYPRENVVYSVYIRNAVKNTYALVADGLTDTEITIPFEFLPDLGRYSIQVIASYAGTDRKIGQSVSDVYPRGTLIFTLEKGDCAHTNTRVDEKKATCQANGYYQEICDDCGYCIVSLVTVGGHEFQGGICVICGTGSSDTECPIPQFKTGKQTIDLESDLLLEWMDLGADIEYYLYVRHESVSDPNDPGEAVSPSWFTGDHITVDGSFFSRTGEYLIALYARYKDVEYSQQDQGAYLTITVDELVCRHRSTNTVPGVQATCTEDGLTDGAVCADCGHIVTQQKRIPATGHRWNDSTGKTLCGGCGMRLLCPTPVITLNASMLPYGRPLNVSWTLEETPLYGVEYYLYARWKDSPNSGHAGTPVFSSWIKDSSCTVSWEILSKELQTHGKEIGNQAYSFEIFVYARYTDYPGTQSGSFQRVTIGERQALPTPSISSKNGQTIEQDSSFTLAWKPVEAEGADVLYHVYLMKAGRGETNTFIGTTDGNTLTIPKKHFDQADTYVVYMIATDENGYFKDSPSVGVNVYVTTDEIHDKNDYDDPRNYANDFYYEYLGTLDNGDAYQGFYDALDVVMTEFHQNEKADAELFEFDDIDHDYVAGYVNYVEFGIGHEEAFEVYFLYVKDHPLYYWVSNRVVSYGADLMIIVNEAYANGSEREYYNDLIYEGVEDIMQNVLDENSAYLISLSHYESVVKGVDYAFESDGVTPQDADWAHSILGFFDGGKGVVCEGFSETYSLLLNFSEIPNTLVSGATADKKSHGWNLVQMDDGEWYWCDPTWDDEQISNLGYDYRYFCVTDTQDVLYYFLRDGDLYVVDREEAFMDDHFVIWHNQALDMSDALPDRAETPYAGVGDERIMRDTFTVDDMTFAIAGYRKLQLVDVQKTGHVDIPETVYYDGVVYTVISVGTIKEDGTFGRDLVLNKNVTSIYIPKTIRCIWGFWDEDYTSHALLSRYLKTITVDRDNDYYYVKNGALTRK